TRSPRHVVDSAARLVRGEARQTPPLSIDHFLFIIAPFRAALSRVPIAVGTAVFIAIALLQIRSETLGVAFGSAVGALASAWAARRSPEERSPWLALTFAFVILGIARIVGEMVGLHLTVLAGMNLVDLGTFGFSIGAAMCNVAWPEIRRSAPRSLATLVDTITLVA